MIAEPDGAAPAWRDAAHAAAVFAVDPAGAGGVRLRSFAGPVRDRWLALLRESLPRRVPMRRMPLHVTDARLLGGLDLPATLASGRPVAERGLIAECDGGVVLLAMAERLTPSVAAKLGAVLDSGRVELQRDGLAVGFRARVGLVALDEGLEPDERPPSALLDRLAIHLDLADIRATEATAAAEQPEAIAAARERLPHVRAEAAVVHALCTVSASLGIGSLRAPLLALRVARATAALAGRDAIAEEDATRAARWVLGPRAVALPDAAPEPEAPADSEREPEPHRDARSPEAACDGEPECGSDGEGSEDRVLAAACAALPPGLLDGIRAEGGARSGPRAVDRARIRCGAARRGRRVGVRRGRPSDGARLDIVETLRAAAPWQRLRREPDGGRSAVGSSRRIVVRGEDFRVARFAPRTETTAIFVVDASGSTALQRLAEVKGAVELLLAECYVRRDRVALVAFRGREAQILLPPTRSLVRAKRSLAGLPGGGGTPLAAGVAAAVDLARAVERGNGTPLLLFLTDGRANVALDGAGGRSRAEEDAWSAARRLREAGLGALVVDTSPRPQTDAQRLAREMGATYLPLPHADSAALCRAARSAAPPARTAVR